MNGCSILELKPKSPIRFKIYVGGVYYGDVVRCAANKYNASRNGISFLGSNPREAAINALVKSEWPLIAKPVMDAAARAADDDAAYWSDWRARRAA